MISPLSNIDAARQKIKFVLAQITNLAASDFPCKEPQEALSLLSALYQQDLNTLASLTSESGADVANAVCTHCNTRIVRFKPILGFLLRSTNVRNSFEIYEPILDLAKKFLGEDAKLVLSSEWQYSPLTYPAVFKELPNFVFIGLPASESNNALVVPLAGHELGHSVWRHSGAIDNVKKYIEEKIVEEYVRRWVEFERIFDPGSLSSSDLTTDLFLRSIWNHSYKLALKQCEEVFCDFIGIKLFSESFLYSFQYLIAPDFGALRSPNYPSITDRVKYLEHASIFMGSNVPENFTSCFDAHERQLPNKDAFVLSISDSVTKSMIDILLVEVDSQCSGKDIKLSSDEERDRIVKRFEILRPASDISSLADIVNAGWKIRLDDQLWAKYGFNENEKTTVLNDLLYKTIEVLEFEYLTRQ